MNKLSVQSLNECFNVDGPNWIYDDSNTIPTGWNASPWNKGTKGLTSCPDHQKEINRQMMLNRYKNGLDVKGANNPRAKTWRVVYNDGREIIIKALQRWAVDNGYSTSGIKKIAYGHWKTYRDIVKVEEIEGGTPKVSL